MLKKYALWILIGLLIIASAFVVVTVLRKTKALNNVSYFFTDRPPRNALKNIEDYTRLKNYQTSFTSQRRYYDFNPLFSYASAEREASASSAYDVPAISYEKAFDIFDTLSQKYKLEKYSGSCSENQDSGATCDFNVTRDEALTKLEKSWAHKKAIIGGCYQTTIDNKPAFFNVSITPTTKMYQFGKFKDPLKPANVMINVHYGNC